MNRYIVSVFLVALMAVFALTSYGQMIPRQDAVWARTTTTPITLDGVLDEPDWAVAESLHIYYGQRLRHSRKRLERGERRIVRPHQCNAEVPH
jgi:hypothetical protein